MADPDEFEEVVAPDGATAAPDGTESDQSGSPDEGAQTTGDAEGGEMAELLQRMQGEVAEVNDRLMRNQADFENAKRRLERQATEAATRGSGDLADKLLPVLDACDSAMQHGAAEVEPIFAALLGTLEKDGLVRVAEAGAPFDPNVHEAVFHEPAADDDGTVVSEVLRSGYLWNGRVLRPAMVKVRG